MENELAQALERILSLFGDITFLPFAATLVVLLTGVVKRFTSVPAGLIALAFQVAVWVGFKAVQHYGYGEGFQDWIEAATVIIQTLLPLLGGQVASGWIYQRANKAAVPLFGFKKS